MAKRNTAPAVRIAGKVYPLRVAAAAHVPDLHGGDRVVSGHHSPAVRREGHPDDSAAGVLGGKREQLSRPVSGDLPYLGCPVVAAGDQPSGIGAPVGVDDLRGVAGQRELQAPGRRLPDPCGPIEACRGDPSTVRAPGDLFDLPSAVPRVIGASPPDLGSGTMASGESATEIANHLPSGGELFRGRVGSWAAGRPGRRPAGDPGPGGASGYSSAGEWQQGARAATRRWAGR
jgi:hypothetical protein